MSKRARGWKVLPHGPVTELAENLWTVEGSLDDMPLRRVMTVAQRGDGSLVVHNPIALEAAAMTAIEDKGTIAALVVPNGWHRLDARAFKERYPSAKVVCPAGARKRVGAEVPVDATYQEWPADRAVALEPLDGVSVEGVLRVRSLDGTTLVFNDIVFNQPRLPGVFGFVYHHVVRSSGGPKVPLVAKLLMVQDRRALRAHLERLAETPDLRRVVVMHGVSPAPGEAASFLREVAATLA
jgi:hypothetical protein